MRDWRTSGVRIVAIAGVLLALAAWFAWHRHNRSSVDRFTKELRSADWPVQSNAQVRLRELGTNALPALLEKAAAQDSTLRSNIVNLLGDQRVLPVPSSAREEYREAQEGFAALGTNANAAIPELLRMLEDPRTANRASGLLNELNNDAIPALIIATTNAEVQVRRRSLYSLGNRRVNSAEVVGAMTQVMLSDEDASTRRMAAICLGQIPRLPDSTMEPLRKALEDVDPSVAGAAAQTLGASFGERAKEAVPQLVELWKKLGRLSPIPLALSRIDPETARRIGAWAEVRPNPYE